MADWQCILICEAFYYFSVTNLVQARSYVEAKRGNCLTKFL